MKDADPSLDEYLPDQVDSAFVLNFEALINNTAVSIVYSGIESSKRQLWRENLKNESDDIDADKREQAKVL